MAPKNNLSGFRSRHGTQTRSPGESPEVRRKRSFRPARMLLLACFVAAAGIACDGGSSGGGGGSGNGSPTVLTAMDDTAVTTMLTPVDIQVLANDSIPNGVASLTFEPTENGVVQQVASILRYTPNSGFHGVESFSYTIGDSTGAESTATVFVYVNVAPPIANDDNAATSATALDSIPVVVNVLANDSDPNGGTLSLDSFTSPANGTAELWYLGPGGTPPVGIRYTPNPGFYGVDTLQYTVRSSFDSTAEATVTINVQFGGNTPPTAEDFQLVIPKNTATDIDVVPHCHDPDGDPLEVTEFSPPAHGALINLGNGVLRYTPEAGFFGVDGFDYTVGDGNGGFASASVTIIVQGWSVASETVIHGPGGAYSVAAADFNGNGMLDLAFLDIRTGGTHDNPNPLEISIHFNTTPGPGSAPTFAPGPIIQLGGFSLDFVVADLNRNGLPDIATCYLGFGSLPVVVFFNNPVSPGQFLEPQIVAFLDGPDAPYDMAVADFDGDGANDLVVFAEGGVNTGRHCFVLRNATTDADPLTAAFDVAWSRKTGEGSGHFSAVSVADFNGDGLPDIAVTAWENGGEVHVFTNVTVGDDIDFSDPVILGCPGAGNGALAAGDLNGNGLPDLVVVTGEGAWPSTFTPGKVAVLLNETLPGVPMPDFAAPRFFDAGVGAQGVILADLNGNARLDIAVCNNYTVSIYHNLTVPGGEFELSPQEVFDSVPGASIRLITVDLNDDGVPDIVVGHDEPWPAGSTNVVLGGR